MTTWAWDSVQPMGLNDFIALWNQRGKILQQTVREAGGFSPVGVSTITVTASPMTYRAGPRREVVSVMGGTVSLITKSGVTVATTTNQMVPLAPTQTMIVTYSVAPTMAKDVG